METYGGHEATIVWETSEYGWISEYGRGGADERVDETSLALFAETPSADGSELAGGVVVPTPEVELLWP